MARFHVKGVDRKDGSPLEVVVEADDKNQAATKAGFLVEHVQLYREPIKLPDLPQYPGLLYSSLGMKWVAIVLAPCYLIAKITDWYVGFYGDWDDVLQSLTTAGMINYFVTTIFGLIPIGLLYVGSEIVSAFRDIAINTTRKSENS